MQQQFNNNFFGYEGVIGRKNYAINLLILVALFIAISFVKFENFAQFTTFDFLYKILFYIVEIFKFAILMSIISLVYRRITDFSQNKSYKFHQILKKLFTIIFVFPILYIYCIRFFISTIPIIQIISDIIILYILIPLGIISGIAIGFLKGN